MEEETSTGSQPVFTDLSSETLLSLGDSYHVDGNYEEAVEAYAGALSLFRDSEVLLQIRTLSHRSSAFYKLKRYQEALDDAEGSLVLLSTKKPSGLRTGEGETCHLRVGLAAFELKQYQKANDMLQKVAQLASLNKRQTNKDIFDNLLEKCTAKLSAPEETSTSRSETDEKPSSEDNIPQANVVKPTGSSAPAKATATAATRPALAGKKGKAPKYQYYQSDKVMTISILEAGVRQEDVTVQFEPKHLLVTIRKESTDYTVVAGYLYSEIDVQKSKVVFKEEKVLVKLRKVEQYEWPELMGKGDDGAKAKKKTTASTENAKDDDATTSSGLPKEVPSVPEDAKVPRPYASHRDWDAIEKNIIEDEKNEKPEGDEAMNKLFKQIYGNATDDTRRAMVKSFQTSGGTVLSTNWDEVKKKDYEKERTGKKRNEMQLY